MTFDRTRLDRESNKLLQVYCAIGEEVHRQVEKGTYPAHPSPSLVYATMELICGGQVPERSNILLLMEEMSNSVMDEERLVERVSEYEKAMVDRDVLIITGTFRWAQRCFEKGIKYDELLQCTCAEVSEHEFEELYQYLLDNQEQRKPTDE